MATIVVKADEYRTGARLPSGPTPSPTTTARRTRPRSTAAAAGFTSGLSTGGYGLRGDVRRDQMASFVVRVLEVLVRTGRRRRRVDQPRPSRRSRTRRSRVGLSTCPWSLDCGLRPVSAGEGARTTPLQEWTDPVVEEVGLDGGPDIRLLLDLARDVAHGVERPAPPLTTYFVGQAVAQGADPADVAARLSAMAARWA